MNDVMENLLKLQKLEMETKKVSAVVKDEIQVLRQLIAAPMLTHYDRLRVRGKKGVAIVRNGVCSECHVQVAVGVVPTLMHADDIQLCGNCGRYLFLPEDASIRQISPVLEPKTEGKKRKLNLPAHAH